MKFRHYYHVALLLLCLLPGLVLGDELSSIEALAQTLQNAQRPIDQRQEALASLIALPAANWQEAQERDRARTDAAVKQLVDWLIGSLRQEFTEAGRLIDQPDPLANGSHQALEEAITLCEQLLERNIGVPALQELITSWIWLEVLQAFTNTAAHRTAAQKFADQLHSFMEESTRRQKVWSPQGRQHLAWQMLATGNIPLAPEEIPLFRNTPNGRLAEGTLAAVWGVQEMASQYQAAGLTLPAEVAHAYETLMGGALMTNLIRQSLGQDLVAVMVFTDWYLFLEEHQSNPAMRRSRNSFNRFVANGMLERLAQLPIEPASNPFLYFEEILYTVKSGEEGVVRPELRPHAAQAEEALQVKLEAELTRRLERLDLMSAPTLKNLSLAAAEKNAVELYLSRLAIEALQFAFATARPEMVYLASGTIDRQLGEAFLRDALNACCELLTPDIKRSKRFEAMEEYSAGFKARATRPSAVDELKDPGRIRFANIDPHKLTETAESARLRTENLLRGRGIKLR